ncbi:MAG: amino acid-binding protein [Lachnospiraceae bacterium]|nr:amino acid-binding protein [Lachnospiraceae bacterium]MBR4807519.1 amino acid-binding protein [Lachnospiraceae bacterium]
MITKQVSVFIENKEGRFLRVAELLKDNNINIISFSIAETEEFGMLRMVVSDPDKTVAILKEGAYSAKITDVITVNLPNEEGTLFGLLKVIADTHNNIRYMYTSLGDAGPIVLKTTNQDQVVDALKKAGYEV